jgi:hypothetical protein
VDALRSIKTSPDETWNIVYPARGAASTREKRVRETVCSGARGG